MGPTEPSPLKGDEEPPVEPSPLMSDQDTHVFYVKAEKRKMRNVFSLDVDDLRCGWRRYSRRAFDGSLVKREENDYHKCNVSRKHPETGRVIPAGSYYIMTDVEPWQYFSHEPDDSLDCMEGKRVVMETLDPEDPTKRLQFRFWSHDDFARNTFIKITNQMEIIAIAGTGL